MRELAGIVIREHLRFLKHPSVGIIPELITIIRILVKLQHHRVHLVFQAVLKELLLFNQTVQHTQLITVIITQFLLVAFLNEKEISSTHQKNDYKYAYISFPTE